MLGKGKNAMPSIERKIEIEKTVDSIIEQNSNIQIPAFDIVKFLKDKEHFAIATQPMTDNTTGVLLVNDEELIQDTGTNRLIIINSLLQEKENYIQRRRFIIAHEFGHFVLHKNETRQFAHRDTNKRDTVAEKEADFFARCLLMPKNVLETILKLDFLKDMPFDGKVALISRIFNVTKKKAEQRLKEDLCYNG